MVSKVRPGNGDDNGNAADSDADDACVVPGLCIVRSSSNGVLVVPEPGGTS